MCHPLTSNATRSGWPSSDLLETLVPVQSLLDFIHACLFVFYSWHLPLAVCCFNGGRMYVCSTRFAETVVYYKRQTVNSEAFFSLRTEANYYSLSVCASVVLWN